MFESALRLLKGESTPPESHDSTSQSEGRQVVIEKQTPPIETVGKTVYYFVNSLIILPDR